MIAFVGAVILIIGGHVLSEADLYVERSTETTVTNSLFSSISRRRTKSLIVRNKIKKSTPSPRLNKTPSLTNHDATTTSAQPPILLKSIGINLDYYDAATNRAGDFVFTKQPLHFKRLFMNYGFFIPSSSASPDKYNPQPTFILPLGTPVRSLVDGIVVAMPTLWSGDYSIQVTTNGKMERWVYETEHILNPKVKVGDRVTAGQIIGEVSNFDQGAPAGYGAVEIGILKGGNPPQHVCPFEFLDPSIKPDITKKILALYSAWESYLGDASLYDETLPIPGCSVSGPIDG